MPILTNTRHEAFAQARAASLTVDAAYIEAGYRPNRGNAARMNANESIQQRVAELLDAAAERAELTGAEVLKEIARVGLSDIRQAFAENGHLRPIHEFPDDFSAAVSSVKIMTKAVPGTDAFEVEHVIEIKLWDKNSALEKLAKRFKLYEGEGKNPAETLLQAIMGNARPLPVAT